ncbi:MAG: hypothetical protein TQ37_09800, partial [Candidatus Synechococcus spongiarum 15L]
MTQNFNSNHTPQNHDYDHGTDFIFYRPVLSVGQEQSNHTTLESAHHGYSWRPGAYRLRRLLLVAAYPGRNSAAYPGRNSAAYPGRNSAAYPGRNSAAYPGRNSAAYPGRNSAAY